MSSHIQDRSRQLTNRPVRYNRMLDKLGGSQFVAKVPRDMSADEENVMFGLGTTAAIAPGVSATLTQNAPRDLILRRLNITDLANPANGNFTISAVTVEGKALLQGSACPGALFIAQQVDKPEFDVPAASGTPVSITVTNTATVGNVTLCAALTID